MPLKHQIERRRRHRLEAPPKSPEDDAPSSDENREESQHVEPDASDNDSDEEEIPPPARDSPSDEEEISSSKSESEEEEEPDNPDDEDFVVNESSSSQDDDLDDDYEAPTSGRTSRRRSRVTSVAAGSRRSRRPTRSPVQNEFGDGEESSDEPSRPSQRRGRTRNTLHDSSEEDDYTPARRAGRRQRRRVQYRDDSDSEKSEDEDEDYSGRRSTPSRASALRANKKLHETLEVDKALDFLDQDEENEELNLPMITPRKRRKGGDSDEDEYVAGNNEEEDDDDALSAEEDSESLVDTATHNVDNDSFCSVDSSKDGDGKLEPSSSLQIRYPRRKRRPVSALDSSDEDDASISEFQTAPGRGSHRQPMVVSCPSTHDVITMDPLPEKHVCYITPDKETRQCFALETLHKIAMTSQHKHYQNGKQTFPQPPHFRSAMSDDLLDQIASRFGRSALDLGGYFYNRDKALSGTPEEDDYMVRFEGGLANTEIFVERLNDYISNLMGHQDLYCCPLCYIEAYHSLMNPHESGDDDDQSKNESDNEDDADMFTFSHDPMTILGSLDDYSFKLASNFCFTKISQVKSHLRDAHHVDTSVLDGNSLFPRFKIRESDGLLQRYIDNCHWMAYQGSMRRYWNDGNNQMFIQLLHLMKRTQLLKKAIADDPQNENHTISDDDMMLLDDAEVFIGSFQNRAKRVWERLSAPYRKVTKQELDDFIVDDDGGEESAPPMFRHEVVQESNPSPEEQVVAALQRRRRESRQFVTDEREASGSDGNDSQSSAHDESDESSNYSEEDEQMPGQYSDAEEEEQDEWVQQIRDRRKTRVQRTPKSPSKRHRRIVESDESE